MSETDSLPTTETDFVVMGTGAGGLLAALTASQRGARVVVVEKADVVGGTTAVSGGVIWVPNNHHMAEVGCPDDPEAARTYLRRIAEGQSDEALRDRYVDAAREMVRFTEAHAPVTFTAMPEYPDYQPELPGGRTGGRSLDNGLYDTNRLGAHRPLLRKNPTTGRVPITIPEAMAWGVFSNPFGVPYQEVAARAKAGIVHGGAGLVGKLLEALLARGVVPEVSTPGVRLHLGPDGGVDGLVVRRADGEHLVRARMGVLFASGGFEWDPALCAAFLPPGFDRPASPPQNTGDALRMAMALGADLGAMGEAWWSPVVDVPGELYDGVQLHRCEFSVRCLPHAIIVNARGERFTNEAGNYNDITKPFFDHAPARYARRNLPAHLIVDHAFLSRYVLVTAVAGRPLPEYVRTADTLEGLAALVGIDPAGLRATVDRWNGHARAGVDPDFGRGASAFDRFYGDPRSTPNPSLGAVEQAPFYAVPIHPGAMGTKGGPKTTVDGQVVRVGGAPVRGLYACGNAMASVMGHGYPGAGATIGASMTFGWLAALHATGAAFEAGT